MGYFKDMLGSTQSVFRDHIPLDFDYLPKVIPYRETEQRNVASCIKPLFSQRNGRNLFLHGVPGIGKTACCKHLLKELEDETDEVIPLYINCWQKNTSYKIMLEMCDMLNYKFTHNKKTDELFKIVRDILNKKGVVIVLDEVDKLEDMDALYFLLEELYRKSIILITNYKSWLLDLDERIKSRLTAEVLEFRQYNDEETRGILKQRMEYAFVPGCFEESAFDIAAKKASDMGDIRAGLYLLKEAGNAAEDKSSAKITTEHINTAIRKLEDFYIKKKDDLDTDNQFILDLIKKNSGKKIGDVFTEYQKLNGAASYKSFQRRITKLAESKFIIAKKITGAEGNTTIITHNTNQTSVKTLDEF